MILMNLLNDAGERAEAILLAVGDYQMRVVVRDSKDTTELRLNEDQWIAEKDKPIYIESLIALVASNVERPRAMKAGL